MSENKWITVGAAGFILAAALLFGIGDAQKIFGTVTDFVMDAEQ